MFGHNKIEKHAHPQQRNPGPPQVSEVSPVWVADVSTNTIRSELNILSLEAMLCSGYAVRGELTV